MKTYEVSYMNGERTAVVQADWFVFDEGRAEFNVEFKTVHAFFGVVSIVMQQPPEDVDFRELIVTRKHVDEVFEETRDIEMSPPLVDPISEEQKKTPAVAEWRRIVNLEANNRRISFDQAAKLVNASSPALYGAMLMETGATMEEALRMMDQAKRHA